MFITQMTQTEQVIRSGGRHAPFALDPFDKHGNSRGGKRGSDSLQVVEGHMAKSRHHRFEAFFDFVLTRGGNSRQRPAMKGIDCGNDFKAPFVMTKFTGELEQALIGFGAAIAEEAFTRANKFHQGLGQLSLQRMVVEIGDMNQALGLLDQSFGDGRVRMAQATDRNASAKIQVAFARNVPKITALTVADDQIETAIGRDYVLLELIADGRSVSGKMG